MRRIELVYMQANESEVTRANVQWPSDADLDTLIDGARRGIEDRGGVMVAINDRDTHEPIWLAKGVDA